MRRPDLHVAVFTDNDFAKVNGVTTALRALVDYAPSGVQPRIYTCESRSREDATYLACGAPGIGIPFYREMRMYWPAIGRFARHARRDGTDVIHMTTPGPVGLAAIRVASKLRVPLIGSFHTDLVAYARMLSGSDRLASAMLTILRWMYGQCERVLVPSEATRQQLVADGIASDRLSLWRRGVCTNRFTPSKRSDTLRCRWGADPETPVILYVGRVSREKGLDLLPSLIGRLRALQMPHRVVIVGDGPAREELQVSLPYATFTGTLTPDEVAGAMASADLFLFPSRTDTAGNVVLEAQACGLPVIVSDAGGPREQMVDGRTGVVCRHAAAFEHAVVSLLRNVDTRRAASAAAREYALTRHWSAALGPLYQTYADVCRRPASGTIDPRPALAG